METGWPERVESTTRWVASRQQARPEPCYLHSFDDWASHRYCIRLVAPYCQIRINSMPSLTPADHFDSFSGCFKDNGTRVRPRSSRESQPDLLGVEEGLKAAPERCLRRCAETDPLKLSRWDLRRRKHPQFQSFDLNSFELSCHKLIAQEGRTAPPRVSEMAAAAAAA